MTDIAKTKQGLRNIIGKSKNFLDRQAAINAFKVIEDLERRLEAQESPFTKEDRLQGEYEFTAEDWARVGQEKWY